MCETVDEIPFSVLDQLLTLLTDVPDETLYEGAYYNMPANGRRNMLDSYKAMLTYHPVFKRLFGN